ncbi:murein transglycosylase A [uncultured Litoreibacter sp.]|uniref:murein transglycosylase A n=1 Tax=uncultured Litoreibacter sp. TaxID=1392394 RepID=UPI00262E45BE|nr:murein transglycosylase A [uncultured Litoreibacter sp.]
MSDPAPAAPTYEILTFDQLDGWAEDDHQAALDVFLETCADIDDPEWGSLCALATSQPNARTFFELFFRPVVINGEQPALFTGYYEPELKGSRFRGGQYQYPLYRKPPEIRPGTSWFTREEIEDQGLLNGRGLEIVYINDPVDVFFLQVQGSGRVALEEGGAIRVGYGGKNGRNYSSIGKELVRRGVYDAHQVSAQRIKQWVRNNPIEGRQLLQHNDSFVFFREVSEVPADKGPLGAMNRSITPMRSIAVDPAFTKLGAPVWIEKAGRDPLKRLMIAQDTGSAIKGAQRADIYYGTGAQAGAAAGTIKDKGRLVVLMPIQTAYVLAPGG